MFVAFALVLSTLSSSDACKWILKGNKQLLYKVIGIHQKLHANGRAACRKLHLKVYCSVNTN